MIKFTQILVFLFYANLFPQQVDSVSLNLPKVDSASLQKKTIVTPTEKVKLKQAEKSLLKPKVYQEKNFGDEIFSKLDINLWTIFYILIVFLIGYFLTKLISLSRSLKIYKKYTFLDSLQIYLKIFLWIIIFYFIVASLASQVSLVLLLLILVSITIFSTASIKFLQNIIGGLYLNITNPFQKGDFIRINEFEGEVQKIELRNTTILSETNSLVSIPNLLFLSVPVINVNRGQIEQLLTVSYEFPFEYSPNKIIKVLYEAALSSPYALSRYKPKVYYTKSDYKKQMRVFEIQVFVFDGKFENEMIHNLNIMISKSLDSLSGKLK